MYYPQMMNPPSRVYSIATTIGVDVGKKQDPTAICVIEPQNRTIDDVQSEHYLIRHLERVHLGTRYPDVADRVDYVAEQVALKTEATPKLYIDATGVGQAVADILKDRNRDYIALMAVDFVSGKKRREDDDGIKLGKTGFVSRLQRLLQTGRIHAPRNPETEALAEELLNYEIRQSEEGVLKFGAFRTGTHDDLVTALGLAVQVDTKAEESDVFGF